MSITASPAKLKSGAWGARVQGRVAAGDTITITTRAGKSWTATVSRVLWTGDGVTLVATESSDQRGGHSHQSRSRGTWTGCSCGSVEEFEKSSDCWSCRHDRY